MASPTEHEATLLAHAHGTALSNGADGATPGHQHNGTHLAVLAHIAPHSDPSTVLTDFQSGDADTGKIVLEEGGDILVEYPLPDEGDFSVRKHWRAEVKLMLQLALPCILANTSTQVMVITSQIFVGHLGVEQFAAAALANTWFNLLWAFISGAATAMDTLASQAYGGKDYRSLLVWTFTALTIMSIYCAPICVALIMSEHVAAVIFHQGYGDVSTLVKEFCMALIPGMWPLVFSLILMKFLQVQNSMASSAIVVLTTTAVHIALTYVMVETLGFVGAAWATTIARGLQAFLIVIVCWWEQRRAVVRASLQWADWFKVSGACLRTSFHPRIMWEFFKISIAGGGMNAFEGGACEVTTAFSGALGTVVTAAHAALLSICITFFNSLPFAVSIAATIRVGNLLGAGRSRHANMASNISMILGTSFQTLAGVAMGASQGAIVRMFTSDPEVLAAVKEVSLLAMGFMISDGFFGVAQGILRAMGKQHACLWYNIIGFWGFGVGVGYVLTFQAHLGLKGLWIGLMSGDMAAGVLSCIAVWRIKWRDQAQAAWDKIQQAAAERDLGDVRDQLHEDMDDGLVASVDLSEFELEIKFFVVEPIDPVSVADELMEGAENTAGEVPVAVTGRQGSIMMFAAGFAMDGRGASVSAAAFQAQRRNSVLGPRFAVPVVPPSARSSVSSMLDNARTSSRASSTRHSASRSVPASQQAGASFRHSLPRGSVIPGALVSLAENKSVVVGIDTADLDTQLRTVTSDRFSADSSRFSAGSQGPARVASQRAPRPRAAHAGGLAAALSRGGSVTASHHPFGQRTGSILASGPSALLSSVASFLQRGASVRHSTLFNRIGSNASNLEPGRISGRYDSNWDRPSGQRDSMGQRMSGVFLYGGYRGSSTAVPYSTGAAQTSRPASSSNFVTRAGSIAATLSRGGRIPEPSKASPPHATSQPSHLQTRGSSTAVPAPPVQPAPNTHHLAGSTLHTDAEMVPLPTSTAINIPHGGKGDVKPAPTTSALIKDMEAGLGPPRAGAKIIATRKTKNISLRSTIMHKGVQDNVQQARSGGSGSRKSSSGARRSSSGRLSNSSVRVGGGPSRTPSAMSMGPRKRRGSVHFEPATETGGEESASEYSTAAGTATPPASLPASQPQLQLPSLAAATTTDADAEDTSLGPIARAARSGSNQDQPLLSGGITPSASPAALPTHTAGGVGGSGASGAATPSGEVAAMGNEQLNQMILFLQQEMLRRQQQEG